MTSTLPSQALINAVAPLTSSRDPFASMSRRPGARGASHHSSRHRDGGGTLSAPGARHPSRRYVELLVIDRSRAALVHVHLYHVAVAHECNGPPRGLRRDVPDSPSPGATGERPSVMSSNLVAIPSRYGRVASASRACRARRAVPVFMMTTSPGSICRRVSARCFLPESKPSPTRVPAHLLAMAASLTTLPRGKVPPQHRQAPLARRVVRRAG